MNALYSVPTGKSAIPQIWRPVGRRAPGQRISAHGHLGMLVVVLLCGWSGAAWAQTNQPVGDKQAAGNNAVTNASANPTTQALAQPERLAGAAETDGSTRTNKTPDEIQVSFQGANVDMIVQWLAQTTGKSVVKHPQVQCQLTITSSKKISTREAINLVYQALSMEGFTVVESANSIFLVPEGKEPKINPELLTPARKDIPEGRQRLVKIFSLAHIPAGELREKVRGVLSDKGTIDVDERANQLIVTDYNDNLRLLAELITEFDVPASDAVIQIYVLKHADAEELGTLLGLILNSQSSSTAAPSRPAGGGAPSRPPGMPSPGGPMPEGASPGASSPAQSGNAGASQPVRIWPDRSANRLIVSAAKSRLVELERLLAILDVDKTEDVAIRVIPLKNVSAEDLAKELAPLYQRAGGKTGKDMIEIAASDRANSLIVLASESNFKSIEKVVASLDTEEAVEKVVRTFPLKNADAQDVAKQLQDLNKDQDSSSRYPFYIFSSSPQGKGARKMSVVADRRRTLKWMASLR
jgi:type II secretory pathway component GspD/PulD (secretin)